MSQRKRAELKKRSLQQRGKAFWRDLIDAFAFQSDVSSQSSLIAALTARVQALEDAAGGGGGLGFIACILTKSSSVTQNAGGVVGTITWFTWDGQTRLDSDFSHSTSTNPERITINTDGWYKIVFRSAVHNAGSSRVTQKGVYRINGGPTLDKGTVRDYSRGQAYGNMGAGIDNILQLSAGDYIEFGVRNEYVASGTYVLNTYNASEVFDETNHLEIVRIE